MMVMGDYCSSTMCIFTIETAVVYNQKVYLKKTYICSPRMLRNTKRTHGMSIEYLSFQILNHMLTTILI